MFAKEGAAVLVSDIDEAPLMEVVKDITAAGAKADGCAGDVRKLEDCQKIMDKAVKKFGKIDILVNSAGIFGDNKRVVDMSAENWDKVIAVDLKGSFLSCRAVAREMVKRNSGKIINISSASSFKALPGMAAYAAAKAAIIMLTKTLALELARNNIQVNTLSPGYFITPLNRDLFETEGGKKLIAGWPMRRPGNTDELKGIIIGLASATGNYQTGSEVLVDGGQWL